MMSPLLSIIIIFFFSLSTKLIIGIDASTLDIRQVPVLCNICRRHDRPLLNPQHTFTMSNGISWTCHFLQETVQDVDEDGWESERLMCRHAQLQAENHGCECGGEYLEPLSEQYSDIHPACDMCASVSNSPIVPFSNYGKTVDTQLIGTHNCKGLFEAMADGILSKDFCPIIQEIAGPICCLEGSIGGTGTSGTSSSQYSQRESASVSAPTASPPISSPPPFLSTLFEFESSANRQYHHTTQIVLLQLTGLAFSAIVLYL